MKLAVVGLGYVGLTLARQARQEGIEVIGVEIDRVRAETLRLTEQFLIFDNYENIRDCEVAVIAVPTPLSVSREPDTSFLREACNSLKDALHPGTLIINESTSYPGTLRNVIIPIVNSHKSKETVTVYFASAPERVDPGRVDWNQENLGRHDNYADNDGRWNCSERVSGT